MKINKNRDCSPFANSNSYPSFQFVTEYATFSNVYETLDSDGALKDVEWMVIKWSRCSEEQIRKDACLAWGTSLALIARQFLLRSVHWHSHVDMPSVLNAEVVKWVYLCFVKSMDYSRLHEQLRELNLKNSELTRENRDIKQVWMIFFMNVDVISYPQKISPTIDSVGKALFRFMVLEIRGFSRVQPVLTK